MYITGTSVSIFGSIMFFVTLHVHAYLSCKICVITMDINRPLTFLFLYSSIVIFSIFTLSGAALITHSFDQPFKGPLGELRETYLGEIHICGRELSKALLYL